MSTTKRVHTEPFLTEPYATAKEEWPCTGKHILAQFDNDSILVYQAYRKEIADYAVENGKFAGCAVFNMQRMTWIKTNFLWMMYRCDWGSRKGKNDVNQERILAIRLKRAAFDGYLEQACTHGKRGGTAHDDDDDDDDDDEQPKKGRKEKKKQKKKQQQQQQKSSALPDDDAATTMTVRLQWDPDHLPNGRHAGGRRAIQLGLKGVTGFMDGNDIVEIQDITPFVHEQREKLNSSSDDDDDLHQQLQVAQERVYTPGTAAACKAVGIDGSRMEE
jgi:Domain of unknown function (DUF4291)